MEHEKQVEVVKQALELETQIQVLEQFLPEERHESSGIPQESRRCGRRPITPSRLFGTAARSTGC